MTASGRSSFAAPPQCAADRLGAWLPSTWSTLQSVKSFVPLGTLSSCRQMPHSLCRGEGLGSKAAVLPQFVNRPFGCDGSSDSRHDARDSSSAFSQSTQRSSASPGPFSSQTRPPPTLEGSDWRCPYPTSTAFAASLPPLACPSGFFAGTCSAAAPFSFSQTCDGSRLLGCVQPLKPLAPTEDTADLAFVAPRASFPSTDRLSPVPSSESLRAFPSSESLRAFPSSESLRAVRSSESLRAAPSTESLRAVPSTESLRAFPFPTPRPEVAAASAADAARILVEYLETRWPSTKSSLRSQKPRKNEPGRKKKTLSFTKTPATEARKNSKRRKSNELPRKAQVPKSAQKAKTQAFAALMKREKLRASQPQGRSGGAETTSKKQSRISLPRSASLLRGPTRREGLRASQGERAEASQFRSRRTATFPSFPAPFQKSQAAFSRNAGTPLDRGRKSTQNNSGLSALRRRTLVGGGMSAGTEFAASRKGAFAKTEKKFLPATRQQQPKTQRNPPSPPQQPQARRSTFPRNRAEKLRQQQRQNALLLTAARKALDALKEQVRLVKAQEEARSKTREEGGGAPLQRVEDAQKQRSDSGKNAGRNFAFAGAATHTTPVRKSLFL